MNYDMNTYAAYNNFETYGGSAGEQQYTSVNQAPDAYPWNASASAPVASQSTSEQPSQQYDYNYGYGNYSGGYQDYSEGYDYGYDGSYDQWNTTSSNTTITSPAKPPQRGGYTPAETQRGGYAQSMAPKRGGYAPAETSQRGGFAQSAAPQTGSYAQSDSSQTGGYAQPPPPQRGGFTQPPPMQRGGYIQPPPPQRGGYAQAPPPQRGGFIQPPPSQRGSYTQAPPPQRGGYTQPPPSLIGGYTQPPPSQFGGYTQPPPQRGGYSQSGAPQKSDYTPEATAQRGGYIQTATTQNYEYTGPAGDNAFAGGNVQGEAPFGRGRGVAGMRGGGRGMGAGRATIGEQNWSNDGDNAKPWNVDRGGFNNNIGYEAKKPFGFGSGNRGRGRGGRQDETGFGHFVQSANNNRVPMNQESINASSTTQALISRWKTFTRGFTDCGNPISNLECSLKASKINILQLQFECKFLSKCNTYSIFTGVLHINKIVDNNVTESLFIARGVGLSKKSAKMDCYEKAYNLLLNSKVQDIVSQRDCGEAKLSQDVQTLYKENPEEFSELLKKSIALIEVVVPKAPQTPINSGQGATRGRGHTGNQGISRGGTQAMGRGGVGVSRGGLGVGRGAGQAMGRGGPGVGRGAGQAMGRGGLGVGRGAGQAMGRGGGQAISRGGGGSHGVGRGGSLGTSSAVNKVAGRGGIQAGSRGGSIIGKKRASNTSLSDIDAKRPRFSLAPTKTVGILMNPADPLIDKLAKLKELLKEEGITKLHIVPKVDQIAHKTAINIKNIYRFQDVPILGFESKMPVYCEVYFDDVFMADGIADFKRNVAMQDAYNNLATTLYSKPLEAIVSCSRIWQAYMCSDPDVCNVVTKWQGEDNNSLLTSNLTNMKQMMQSMPDVTIPIEKMVLTEHESDKDIQNIFKALELSATRNLMLLECEIVRNPDLKFTCSISLQGRLLASRTHGTKNGAKRVCSEAVMNELKKNNDYIFVATEYIGKKITNQELVLEAAKKKALGEPPAKVFFKKPEHKDGENAKPEVDATKFELENKVETEEMKALVPWMAAVMYDIIDDYYQKITLEDLMVNVTDMTKIQRDVVNACASKMGLRVITKLKTHTDSSLLRRTVTAQDMCKMLQLHGGQSGRYKLVTCKNKLSEVEKEKFRAECLQQHKKLVDARTNDDPDAQPTEPTPAPIKSTVRPAAKTAPAPQTRPAPKIRPASAYRPVRPQSRPAFRVPHHMQAVNRPMPLMSSNLPYGPPRMPRFPFPRF